MNWFTADYHLGEERFDLLQRPFKNPHEQSAILIKNHNSVVNNDDFVYVLGDVLYREADPKIWLPTLDLMNGRKILVRGNHDRPFTDEQFQPHFEKIIPEGDGIELAVGDIDCYLTHYPTRGREDRFNLVGHVHSAWKYQLNMMNVGIDTNHFRPVSPEEILLIYRIICNFSDEDIWVGYNNINMNFRSLRGKTTQYFQGK